ncbi:MAG: hypothetical protein IJU58_00840 [Clostridia bacterium]|nr:hypothetical protein [Clostridia bacterium]
MRKQSREIVFKLLFAKQYGQKIEQNDFDIDELLGVMLDEMGLDIQNIDIDYVRDTYNAVVASFEHLSDVVNKHVNKYAQNRIYNADFIILALAIYELEQNSLDSKIVVSEAIKLAKKYSTENSIKFVNGVLGAIIKEKND